MFNQSGEQRPGWYVLAVRWAKITSSAFSSVNRLREALFEGGSRGLPVLR
jgi:hypothetical protein